MSAVKKPLEDTLDATGRLLADAEERRAEQVRLLEEQAARGEDTAEGERVLRGLEDTLTAVRTYQWFIQQPPKT
jgi:hypothetical protein